jgi:hypothetical protein
MRPIPERVKAWLNARAIPAGVVWFFYVDEASDRMRLWWSKP